MKFNLEPTNLAFRKRLSLVCLFFMYSLSTVSAQINSVICQEGDCLPSIFTIKLNEPLNPEEEGKYSNSRTENFKKAYLAFQEAQKSYSPQPGWEDKYRRFQLGGKSCLRHYQFEAAFAHEYIKNPDFKKWINSNAPNKTTFLNNGFESSRRGLNLSNRMGTHCPTELKKLETGKGPRLSDLSKAYQQLGQELGYFDELGQMLKPMEEIPEEEPQKEKKAPKVSKKEQVTQLKDKVSKLPIGQATEDEFTSLKQASADASPKAKALKTDLDNLEPRFTDLSPKPLASLASMETESENLEGLQNEMLELSNPELVSEISNLQSGNEGLKVKANEIVAATKELNEEYEGLTTKNEKVQEKLEQSNAAIADLEDSYAKLKQKKEDLTAKLEDKPKKILEELTQEIGDIEKESADLVQELEKEKKRNGELVQELDDLTAAKEGIEEKVQEQEAKYEELSEEQAKNKKENEAVAGKVKEAKRRKEKIEKMKNDLKKLKPGKVIKEEISSCEKDLKKLLSTMNKLEEKQNWFKEKLSGPLAKISEITAKLDKLKVRQTNLKLPQNNIPVAKKSLGKLDMLMNKGAKVTFAVLTLEEKKKKAEEEIAGQDAKLNALKSEYASREGNIKELEQELLVLLAEKTKLQEGLNQNVEDVDQMEVTVNDFIDRFNVFDEKSNCISQDDLESRLEALQTEQTSTETELTTLEEELQEATWKEKQLDEDTKDVELEIVEDTRKMEVLKAEEVAMQEEFGEEVKLEPVPMEEWSEEFEVERTYWKAEFYPDNEVVEGFVGRYFAVQLKDAEKSVKMLFGSGKYFMDKKEFSKNYGATFGSFAKETLHYMKEGEEGQVKIFIQGSADISGHETFSGKLDERFFYDKISLLPQKDDPESFHGEAIEKEIPATKFKNEHLPDLRAQFLKEMISAYSSKFDPILLEGVVKKFAAKEERNAVIYMFFPDQVFAKGEE